MSSPAARVRGRTEGRDGRNQGSYAPGPKENAPVERFPGRLPEGASRRARGDGLGIRPVNQAAPAWAGAERACRGVMSDQKSSSGRFPRRTPRPWRGWLAGAAVGALPRLDAGQIRQETEERSRARLGVLRLIGNDSACCLQITPGPLDRFAGCKGKQGKQGQPTKGKPHHDLFYSCARPTPRRRRSSRNDPGPEDGLTLR